MFRPKVQLQEFSHFKDEPKFYPDILDPTRTIQVYNRRFATAIDISDCMTWMKVYKDQVVESCRKYHPNFDLSELKMPNVDTMSEQILNTLEISDPQHPQVLSQAIASAQTAVNLQIDWINSRVATQTQFVHQTQPIHPLLSGACAALLEQGMSLDWRMIHLQKKLAAQEELAQEDYQVHLQSGDILFLGRFIVWKHVSGNCWLLPQYFISIVVSKSIELAACMISASQQRRSDLDQFIMFLIRYLGLIRQAIRQYRNNAHTLLKALDGLGHGALTTRMDKSHSTFLTDNITHDLLQEGFAPQIIQSFVTLFDSIAPFDIPNFSGLSKLYGYPTIETRKGIEKLFTRTHKDIPMTEDAVNRVVNMGKLLFIRSYYKRYKRYPPVKMSHSVDRHLVVAILSNRNFDSHDFVRDYGKVGPTNFEGIELQECVPFDWYDRFYPLIKDTAAGVKRSRITRMFEDMKFVPRSQRVLLNYLRTPGLNQQWKVFRRLFCWNPLLVRDDMVIKLTSKEKEHKVEGRMFGQSPIYERHRRVVGEMNIALLMELFSEDQAMLMNENDKRRKMAFLSRAGYYIKDQFSVIIGVDAEAWNNYFRSPLVSAFGREIFDKIFGVTFYEHIMSVFELGFIYHQDAANNILYWEGQEGGIEGLAQKVWTWIYCVIARLVLHLMELDGYLMVNGDDMRIVALVPKDRVHNNESELEDFQVHMLSELRDLFGVYGITVKTEETNMTRSLICFGKQYVCNGHNYPSDLKKIVKAGGLTDVGFPSITDVIASIVANTHSACGVSYQIIPNVTFAYTLILLYLHWYDFISLVPRDNSCPRLDSPTTTVLLTTPNTLGGLDTLLLYQFIIQGESDPLPLVFDWFKFLWHSDISFHPAISRALGVQLSLILPCELLLTDLFSLPLKRPPRPMALVTRKIRKALSRICRNVELKRLLNFDREERNRVVSSLWRMDPFNPRIASYLYGLSPCALVDSILQKFEAATTLAQILFRNDRSANFRLYTSVIKADRRLIGSIIRRIVQDAPPPTGSLLYVTQLLDTKECATTIAHMVRMESWKKQDMVDDTIPSSITQLMIANEGAFDPQLQTFDKNSALTNHFTAKCFNLIPEGENSGPLCPLVSAPYFAHTTGLRLSARLTDLKGNEPLVSMIRKLTDAQALVCGQGPDLQEWVNWCSISLFGQYVSDFCPSTVSKMGGTVGHRLPARSFERTVYLNTLPSRTGRTRVNLDTVSQSNSILSKNRTHNFSALSCWFRFHSTSDLENDLLSNGTDQILWGIMVACRNKEGDTSTCTCHRELETITYSVAPPPVGLIDRLYRLITTCELTAIPPEAQDMIEKHKEKFLEIWTQPCDYTQWTEGDITQERYILASQCASAIVASLLEPSVRPLGQRADFNENVAFDYTLGINKQFSQLSVRDLACLRMDDLARAVFETSMGFVLDIFNSPLTVHMKDIREVLTFGVYQPLIMDLCVTRSQGRFVLAMNRLIHTFGQTGVGLTHEMLTSPTVMTRALTNAMCSVAFNIMRARGFVVTSLFLYAPGDLTAEGIKRIYLLRIWNLIKLACLNIAPTHRLHIPSRHIMISNMSWPMRRLYFAGCFLMTRAFQALGNIFCPDYYREVPMAPQSWTQDMPLELLHWDPTQPPIKMSDLSLQQQAQLMDSVGRIIGSSFFRTATIRLIIVRIPLRLCVNVCQFWVRKFADEEEEHREALAGVIPQQHDQVGKHYSARPMESDLPLGLIPHGSFDHMPVPREQRRVFDIASLNRYYRLSTSALNKYIEELTTIINLKDFTKIQSTILCTADGAGGVAALCTRLFRNCQVVFNTLVMRQDLAVSNVDCPDEGYLPGNDILRLIAAHNATGASDLSDDLTKYKYISLALDPSYSRYCLLTCDAEAPNIESSPGDPLMVYNLIRIANEALADHGCMIIKRFLTEARQCLILYLYMASSFASVSINKPSTSHDTSGEIFFVAVNKCRSWTSRQIEDFIINPRATHDSVLTYYYLIDVLATQRDHPPGGTTHLQQYVPQFVVPLFVQKLIAPWRHTFEKINDQCKFLPPRWFRSDTFQCTIQDITRLRQKQFNLVPQLKTRPSVVENGVMMTLGACCVIEGYITNATIDDLEASRAADEDQIRELSINEDTKVIQMYIRHYRNGGRTMMGFIGALKMGVLSTDDFNDSEESNGGD